MLSIFIKGGPLMWPILLCSVIVFGIILDRLYYLSRTRTKIPNISSKVKVLVREGKHQEALKLCEDTRGLIPHIIAIAVHIHKKSYQEKERILQKVYNKSLNNLNKNLAGLSVVGTVAPLLGLLGTVTGMIKAFIKIQQLGSSADASVVAGGIWEALITTAAGLSVAIIAIVAYYYFEGRIDQTSCDMKDAIEEVLDEEKD